MPLQTETFTLEEAVADLEDEREDLADAIAQIPPEDRTEENADYVELAQRAGDVEQYLGGLEWIREEYADQGTLEFTLSGLATAETLEIGDRVNDLRSETVTPTSSTDNMATIFWVAKGVDSAPFVDGDVDFEDKCAAVRGLPRQVADWLEERVSELSTVGEREGNSFGQLVAEKTERYHETSS